MDYLDRPLRDSLAILLGSTEAKLERWDEFSRLANSMELAILVVTQVEPGSIVIQRAGGNIERILNLEETEIETRDLSSLIGDDVLASILGEFPKRAGEEFHQDLSSFVFGNNGVAAAAYLRVAKVGVADAKIPTFLVAIRWKATGRKPQILGGPTRR